jgi:putative transcriptional regulator
VVPNVYLVASKPLLAKLLNGSGSTAELVHVFLGYAGWGPGQLEAEVEAGAWHLIRANEASVFDASPDTLWDRLSKRATLRLARGAAFHPASDFQSARPFTVDNSRP